MPMNYTPTLDLPPELQQLLNMDQMGHPAQFQQPVPAPEPTMPNYADGGMVGMDGAPVPGGMPLGAVGGQEAPHLGVQDVDMFAQQNPQAVEQIAMELQQMIQTGELSPQQLQMGEQLATTALNDPETYPQLRQFAVQQGLVSPEDMPEQYDQAVLFAIVLAARAVTGGAEQQPDPAMMNMKDGGYVRNMRDGGYVGPGDNAAQGGKVVGPGTSRSDSIPINVSAGEYVIPAHIVQMKGKEFFDKMLENYRPGGKQK